MIRARSSDYPRKKTMFWDMQTNKSGQYFRVYGVDWNPYKRNFMLDAGHYDFKDKTYATWKQLGKDSLLDKRNAGQTWLDGSREIVYTEMVKYINRLSSEEDYQYWKLWVETLIDTFHLYVNNPLKPCSAAERDRFAVLETFACYSACSTLVDKLSRDT